MKLRNHCGLIVTRDQYNSYSKSVTNRATFIPNNNDPTTRERLWFMLGVQEVILICVDTTKFDYGSFEFAGLLYRISPTITFHNTDGFSDYAHHIIYSTQWRIKLCNDIRDALATSQTEYRWCGAENESLTNANIVRRASEINGATIQHQYIDLNCEIIGECLKFRAEPFLNEIRDNIEEIDSEGQKKLFSCMLGFASPHVDILYIGSAPGDGWVRALTTLHYRATVISIDPRPLDVNVRHDFAIDHYQIAINSPEQLCTLTERYSHFDFVWDVRGDVSSDSFEERMDLIRDEIQLLNQLFSTEEFTNKLRRFQLKINTRSLSEYLLPTNTRLYMQPYCAERNIFELRAVGLFRPSTHLTHISSDLILPLLENVRRVSSALENYDLITNSLGMRLSHGDFLIDAPLYASSLDIALFCINWNSPSSVTTYLDAITSGKRTTICSFFTKPLLRANECRFPEERIIERDDYFVFDSRILIPAKLDGLYFVMPRGRWDIYTNEYLTSETYHIKMEEKRILECSQIERYNRIRHEVCNNHGHLFPKFPHAFSYGDKLVSPSGHVLRTVLCYFRGYASIFQIYAKIIANFKNASANNVSHCNWSKNCELVKNGSSIYENLPRFNRTDPCIERRSTTIWHSLEEWVMGIEAASLFDNNACHDLRYVIHQLRTCIRSTKRGIELYEFMKRARIQNLLRIVVTRDESRKLGIHSSHTTREKQEILMLHDRSRAIDSSEATTWILQQSHIEPILWKTCIRDFRIDRMLRLEVFKIAMANVMGLVFNINAFRPTLNQMIFLCGDLITDFSHLHTLGIWLMHDYVSVREIVRGVSSLDFSVWDGISSYHDKLEFLTSLHLAFELALITQGAEPRIDGIIYYVCSMIWMEDFCDCRIITGFMIKNVLSRKKLIYGLDSVRKRT